MADILLMNGFCCVIVGILLLSIFLQKKEKDESTKNFVILIYAALTCFLINVLCELVEGKPQYIGFSYIVNTLGYVTIDGICIAFSRYLYSLVGKHDEKARRAINTVIISCIVRSIIIVILSAMGLLFSVEGGVFVEKDLSIIPYIISIVILFIFVFIIISNRKLFTRRQFIVIIVYELLPIVPAMLEFTTGMYALTTASVAASILMIYILIQVEELEKGKTRESILEEISLTDLLTKVNNRRAYYEKVGKLDDNKNVGVIFSDINDLKYINDHFGHIAGDETIQKFANVLVGAFRRDDVFRISGDEFVVVADGITDEEFKNRIKALENLINENDKIASFGYAYGIGSCYDRLTEDAEAGMYKAKEDYHKKSGTSR